VKSLYDLLDNAASKHAERIALGFKDQLLSYGVLKDAVDRLASGLKELGFQPGDRIAVMLPNSPHFPIVYFAILRIGCVVIPVTVHCTPEDIRHQLEEAEIKGIVYWEGNRNDVLRWISGLEQRQKRIVLGGKAMADETRLNYLMEIHPPLQEKVDVSPDDTAVVAYTDRMKGRSKGVELTHRNLLANIDACVEFLKLTPEDGTVCAIPLYHMLGQTLAMNLFLSVGGRVDLIPAFQPDAVCRVMREWKLTHFIGVPAMYKAILETPEIEADDFATVKLCLSSGGAMEQEILDAFETKFKVMILEGYSLTEASPMVTFHVPKGERKAGFIGPPLPGIDIRIVDDDGSEILPGKIGEIVVQGPNVMKGYLNRPEATKESLRGGWLHTGDLATLQENGQMTVVSRRRDLIIKSGFTIYPNELESVLQSHPKVTESVVVGMPDPVQGQEIHACVSLKADETATPDEIIAFTKEKLPLYKCPKSVMVVQALPKGPTGRVIRDQIKQMLSDRGIPN